MPISNPHWADRWQAECEGAVIHAANLIRLSGRSPAASSIVELIRTAPRTPDELFDRDCFFARCALGAGQLASGPERDFYDRALEYFEQLSAMRPARRLMLEATLAGVFFGYLMSL